MSNENQSREAALAIEERIERLEEVAERWDVPGGSRRLARRARDKADGLRVARRILADARCACCRGRCSCGGRRLEVTA